MNFREKRYPAVVDLSDPEQVKELGPGSNEEPFFIDVATCGFCHLLFPVTNATLVYNKQDEGKILICQVCAYFTKLTKGNIAKKTGCLGWNNSAQLKKFIQYFELLYDLDNIQPPDGVLGYFCKRLRCNICQKPVSLHETMEQHAEEHHHKSGDVCFCTCNHGIFSNLPANTLICPNCNKLILRNVSQQPPRQPVEEAQALPSFSGYDAQNPYFQGYNIAPPRIPGMPFGYGPVMFPHYLQDHPPSFVQIPRMNFQPPRPFFPQPRQYIKPSGIASWHRDEQMRRMYNYYNVPQCSWCYLELGIVQWWRLCCKQETADVCQYCLQRAEMYRSNVLNFIRSSEHFMKVNKMPESFEGLDDDKIIGFVKFTSQCSECQREIPREILAEHLRDIHTFGVVVKCQQNCKKFFKLEMIDAHRATCKEICKMRSKGEGEISHDHRIAHEAKARKASRFLTRKQSSRRQSPVFSFKIPKMERFCTCDHGIFSNLPANTLICPACNKFILRNALRSPPRQPVDEARAMPSYFSFPSGYQAQGPYFQGYCRAPPIFPEMSYGHQPYLFLPVPPPEPIPRMVGPFVPHHQQYFAPPGNASGSSNYYPSQCSWCYIDLWYLARKRVYLKDKIAEICQFCLQRTEISSKRKILKFIKSSRELLRDYTADPFSELVTGVIGYVKHTIQCSECHTEIPREIYPHHLGNIHNFGFVVQCQQNCKKFFKLEEIDAHGATCRKICDICFAKGSASEADALQLHFAQHVARHHNNIAVCDFDGCLRTFSDCKIVYDHIILEHIWKAL
ncbi:Hypothetical predicted protein [Cloeon dipterum]|uniref:C2H2-type domain-containing protein n=1 Tax=Cloeon dipterum TaxID=197152 RepID=A0A8S1DVF9_9INSE|nr:Hypothetical predicted protein [Cloeon dipterum]